MKVTYLFHSCYYVEFEDKVLIFDYYQGKLPSFSTNKKIYFFVSHSHYDHFNDKIFDMYKDHDVKYFVRKVRVYPKYTSSNNKIIEQKLL